MFYDYQYTMDCVNLLRRHGGGRGGGKSCEAVIATAIASEVTSVSIAKMEKHYDRRFVCQVTDLTKILSRSLTPYDACRTPESHVEVRRPTVILINLAVFGSRLLSQAHAVHNLARIVVTTANAGGRDDASYAAAVNCCPLRLLYAPLTCRIRFATIRGKERRVQMDVYAQSAEFLEKYSFMYAQRRYIGEEYGLVDSGGRDDDVGNGDGNAADGDYQRWYGKREAPWGTETERLLADLQKFQRTVCFNI